MKKKIITYPAENRVRIWLERMEIQIGAICYLEIS